MSSQPSRRNRSTTLALSEAKKRYDLVDEDFEAIIPIPGGEGEEDEYSVWAVLQLAAAVSAGLRYDEVVTGRQASTKYGLKTKRLNQLEPVTRMSNPVLGGVLAYYKLSDVEAQPAPRQGRDITHYFPPRKSAATAGPSSQKSRIGKSASNSRRQ